MVWPFDCHYVMILICINKLFLWYHGWLTAVLLGVEGLFLVWYVDVKNACLIEWKVFVRPWYYHNVAIAQPSILVIRFIVCLSWLSWWQLCLCHHFLIFNQVKIYSHCLDDFDWTIGLNFYHIAFILLLINLQIDDNEKVTMIDFPQMVSVSHRNAQMYVRLIYFSFILMVNLPYTYSILRFLYWLKIRLLYE